MKQHKPIKKIRVPATTANLGPGFDSFGLALSLYIDIDIYNIQDKWFVEHNLGDDIPNDENNLIVATALKVAEMKNIKLKPRHIKIISDIPIERGLGSSSSGIVGGVELANILGVLNLSLQEKLCLAGEIEGHPDNVAAALYGGFVVSCEYGNKTIAKKLNFPEVAIAVVIPPWKLSTEKCRQVLPKNIDYKEGVAGSCFSNLMLAAMVNGDIELMADMMERDIFHEKYRLPLIPHLENIRNKMRESGAYATCISGAGPTVIVFYPKEKKNFIETTLKTLEPTMDTRFLEVEQNGVLTF